jgi:hypothetical protein
MSMRVLGVVGSPRKNGNTETYDRQMRSISETEILWQTLGDCWRKDAVRRNVKAMNEAYNTGARLISPKHRASHCT